MAISEPATRYIGDAIVSIVFEDDDTYSGVVLAGGHTWKFDGLRAPRAGLGRGVAYDSPEAYDKLAASAVSWGSAYTTGERGDAPDWAPPAEVADSIAEAASWAMDDKGRYDVSRKPRAGGPALENRSKKRPWKREPYTSVGSYPIAYLRKPDTIMCAHCAGAKDEGFVNWEDPDLHCEECGDRIESAYAEDDAKKNARSNETPQRRHVSARTVQAAVPRIEAMKAATVEQEADKMATDVRGVNVGGFPGAKVRILKKHAYWSEKRGAPILVVELSAPDEPAWHRIYEGTPDEVRSFLSGSATPNGHRFGYAHLDPTNRCKFAWTHGKGWNYCTLHDGHRGEHYDSLTDKKHQR